jgi:hypothetical protein
MKTRKGCQQNNSENFRGGSESWRGSDALKTHGNKVNRRKSKNGCGRIWVSNQSAVAVNGSPDSVVRTFIRGADMQSIRKPFRFENSTHWPDRFLKRMAAWCCRELDVPVRLIRHYRFRNSRSAWGGCARPWSKQISVCVGPASWFPHSCSTHRTGDTFTDQLECLIAVTAHEIYHVAAHHVRQ